MYLTMHQLAVSRLVLRLFSPGDETIDFLMSPFRHFDSAAVLKLPLSSSGCPALGPSHGQPGELQVTACMTDNSRPLVHCTQEAFLMERLVLVWALIG